MGVIGLTVGHGGRYRARLTVCLISCLAAVFPAGDAEADTPARAGDESSAIGEVEHEPAP